MNFLLETQKEIKPTYLKRSIWFYYLNLIVHRLYFPTGLLLHVTLIKKHKY